jgi:hypothetical protein
MATATATAAATPPATVMSFVIAVACTAVVVIVVATAGASVTAVASAVIAAVFTSASTPHFIWSLASLPSKHDSDLPTVVASPVHLIAGVFGIGSVGVFNEREATRFTRVEILRKVHISYLPVAGKILPQLICQHWVWKISHKQTEALPFPSKSRLVAVVRHLGRLPIILFTQLSKLFLALATPQFGSIFGSSRTKPSFWILKALPPPRSPDQVLLRELRSIEALGEIKRK